MKRKVYQYDLQGNKIGEFESPKEAEIILNLHRGSVSASCNHRSKRAGNYIFRYADDCADISDVIERINLKNTGLAKRVYQYDLQGNYIRSWKSISEASKCLKIKSNISDCCNGKLISVGGYVWSYEKMEKIQVRKKKGKRVTYSFYDMCIQNKELSYMLDEWCDDLNKCSPKDISHKSNKLFYWKCKHNHIWQARPYQRANGSGCPICASQLNTSFPEQAIYFYIQKYFPDSISRYRNNNLGFSEIDIYIPELNIGVEYDGRYYHRDRNKDLEKNRVCNDLGITLFRIREFGLEKLNSTSIDYYLSNGNKTELNDAIFFLFQQINERYHLNILPIINVETDYFNIVSNYKQMELHNSLAEKYPDIASEWDYEKNMGVGPETYSAYSGANVWWKCPKCNHSYKMIISNRTDKKQGCPKCGQERSRQAKLKLIHQYDLQGNYLASYLGAKEAAHQVSIKYHQNINATCKRKQKSAGGYIWRYADDCEDMIK